VRIISKFRDYYDGVMKTGMDREVVYVREKIVSLIDDKYDVCSRASTYASCSLFYLGFCGEIHKVYRIKYDKGPTMHFYLYEDFKEQALATGAASQYEFGRRWWKGSFDKFADFDTAPLKEFFHKYQTPIFLVKFSEEKHKCKLILNPNLKEIGFQRIRDSYTTYQDIFQFVAGVLNHPENKMVKISDADKISKHGFDKWSFRQKGPKK